ncbi:MAG: alpha/beta hydrolase [Promethearchaeota archaeon]
MDLPLLDDMQLASAVFYPRRMEKPGIDKLPDSVSVLDLETADGISIGAFFFEKDPDLPTMVLYHGNGEIAADYIYSAPAYLSCGVNLCVVDFRGYGFSTGKPTYRSLFTDAVPTFNGVKDFIAEKGFSKVMFAFGRSLGSVSVTEIGAVNPDEMKGIIIESGFARTYDLITNLFGISHQQLTRESLEPWSNDTRVKKFQKPTLIIHGTNDAIIPRGESVHLLEAIPKGIYKKLVTIEGAGHNDIGMHANEYFPPLKEFITEFK